VSQTRVLTVGAYERDNFGDLLFLLLTERYLTDCDIVAAAPFAADMTPLLDRRVVALGDALTDSEFDVIWSVGGQIGGTTLDSALRMSKTPAEYAAFRAAAPTEKRALMSAALHGADLVSPYIPTPGAFGRNAAAVTVLNSVGIAGARGLSPHVREEVLEVLRTTDVVSVRDRESSDFLSRIGVAHTLAPDVVHAISLLEPHEPDPASDIAAVQVSTRLLERYGHERLARELIGSSHLGGLRLRFLMAGAASSHDSVEGLERVAEHVRALDPGREVEVLTDRRPLDIVRQIREARVVIGTSLHVRIVAAAYGLPRVTMRRAKPTRYATHWDDQMPFDVRIDDLGDAIGVALAAGGRAEVRAGSERLSQLADDNVRAIAERVGELVGRGLDVERKELAERRQRRHRSIANRREACAVVTDGLRSELAEARRELELSRAEVERLRRRVPIRLRAR
jgi:polysaccharide pyruvyl transferase WcaK-like protein